LEEEQRQEEDVLFSSAQTEPHSVLIRVPGIVTEGNQNTSLGRIFSGVFHRDRKISFPEMEDDNYEFLSMSQLAGLLRKITVSAPENGTYQLSGEYVISKEQLDREVSTVSRKSRLIPDGRTFRRAEGDGNSQLSRKYSYFARDQRRLEFQKLYDEYLNVGRERPRRVAETLRHLRERIPGKLMVILDIIVLFILAEIISKYTSEFVYFKEIDVRLIYIFLIATFHGLKAGVVASLAECVVLYYQYQMMGVYGMQLFYNVENWIPFALCIVVGAVAGYFSDLKEDERQLVNREYELLREKYLFLDDMYKATTEVRDEYRRQILTFENSYGKIYDAVKEMNCNTVEEVCIHAQKVLQRHMSNPSVCIYQWISSGQQIHLLCSSEDFDTKGRKRLRPEERQSWLDALEEGGLYVNVQLEPIAPMYGALHVPQPAGQENTNFDPILILVWEALPEQMNEYYANQFEVLCGLTGDALDRAALLECRSK
jgi:hypothetical protein